MKKLDRAKLALTTETVRAIGGHALADAAGGLIPIISRMPAQCSWQVCPTVRCSDNCTIG